VWRRAGPREAVHTNRASAQPREPVGTPILAAHAWRTKNRPDLPAFYAEESTGFLRLNRIPMGRFGRPEDVVHMALYLASDESTWVNGSVMVVDGGITSNDF